MFLVFIYDGDKHRLLGKGTVCLEIIYLYLTYFIDFYYSLIWKKYKLNILLLLICTKTLCSILLVDTTHYFTNTRYITKMAEFTVSRGNRCDVNLFTFKIT